MNVSPVFIGVGSNTDDKDRQVAEALTFLSTVLQNMESSSVYDTEALNGRDASYSNAVAVGLTRLPADELKVLLKLYERSRGRTAECKRQGLVPIDLDIVVFDNEILRPDDMARDYFLRGYSELNTMLKGCSRSDLNG